MKRIIIAGSIVLGISLLVTALAPVLAPDLLEQPGGLAAIFAAVFLAISALFGGKLSDWVDTIFGKKKEKEMPPEPTTKIEASDEAQVSTGDGGRNIRASN